MGLELMRRFYELFPYPKRSILAFPKIEKQTQAHFAFWRTPTEQNTLKSLQQQESGQKILLCGCGTDEPSLFYFLHKNVYIEAVDLSERSLKIARRRIFFWSKVHHRAQTPKVNFHRGDAVKYVSNQKGAFHHIQCFGVLHHQKNPELLLQGLANALKTNGTIRFMIYAHTSRQLERALQKRFSYSGEGYFQTRWQTFKLKLWKLLGVLRNKPWATHRLRYLKNNTRLFADALMHPSDPGLPLNSLFDLLQKHSLQLCYVHSVCPEGSLEGFAKDAEDTWKIIENWDKRSQLLANITFVVKKKSPTEKGLQ